MGGGIALKGAKIRTLAGDKVLAITMVCGLLKGHSIFIDGSQYIRGTKMPWWGGQLWKKVSSLLKGEKMGKKNNKKTPQGSKTICASPTQAYL